MLTTVRVDVDAFSDLNSSTFYEFDAEFTVEFEPDAIEVLVDEVHIESFLGTHRWFRKGNEDWFALAERWLLGRVQRNSAMLEKLADRVRLAREEEHERERSCGDRSISPEALRPILRQPEPNGVRERAGNPRVGLVLPVLPEPLAEPLYHSWHDTPP